MRKYMTKTNHETHAENYIKEHIVADIQRTEKKDRTWADNETANTFKQSSNDFMKTPVTEN